MSTFPGPDSELSEPVEGLMVGVDRTDITPVEPTALAGFAARAAVGPAREAAAPLHVRSVALRTGSTTVVMVSADLLWWGDDLASELQSLFTERFDLPPEHLILHATHNHSGPQTSQRFTELLGVPDPPYLSYLVDQTLGSIERSLANPKLATVERATTRVPLGVDRRFARADGVHPPGPSPIDDEVTVLRFVTGTDASTSTGAGTGTGTAAMLVHYACHPVLHHGNVVTSDFAGAAMTAIEGAGAADISLYLQGCCGDVNPNRYDNSGVFLNGDQTAVEAMGQELADAVVDLDRRETWTASEGSIKITNSQVILPTGPRPRQNELLALADREDVRGQWAKLLLADQARLREPTSVQVTGLRLSNDTMLLGFSAELVSRYGLYAKEISGGKMLIMGYTNGMTGYVVTDAQLNEGGYEPAEAPYYFGLPAPFAPGVEQAMLTAISDLAPIPFN